MMVEGWWKADGGRLMVECASDGRGRDSCHGSGQLRETVWVWNGGLLEGTAEVAGRHVL